MNDTCNKRKAEEENVDNKRPKTDADRMVLFTTTTKRGEVLSIRAPENTPPTRTLYVRNLPERRGQSSLQLHLARLFEQFGRVTNVVCPYSMHGQAWIVFEYMEDAACALTEFRRLPDSARIFDKPFFVQFAKHESRVVMESLGKLNSYEENLKLRAIERVKEKEERIKNRTKRISTTPLQAQIMSPIIPFPMMPPALTLLPTYLPKSLPVNERVSNVLFVSNLPRDMPTEQKQQILNETFSTAANTFKEVRLVPGKPEICFVEYETESDATMAKSKTNETAVFGKDVIHVTFRK